MPECREVTIVNKLGLHARAAAKFVTLASGFSSQITIKRGGKEVNGKSIMGVMMLAAGKGTEIEICAEGGDAADAADKLVSLVEERFGEAE
ncbi:MAG: HPr family phosphocarrier protein [Gammaproteobacteria bacterium]|nr:HPr family phosphocarrier protein [Gammaproteobacteria bacterium]